MHSRQSNARRVSLNGRAQAGSGQRLREQEGEVVDTLEEHTMQTHGRLLTHVSSAHRSVVACFHAACALPALSSCDLLSPVAERTSEGDTHARVLLLPVACRCRLTSRVCSGVMTAGFDFLRFAPACRGWWLGWTRRHVGSS
jgi:hypothetical protein